MQDNQATQRLADLLAQISKLPGAGLEPPQFFANYLQLSAAATGARGGAIWVIQENQPPQCYCHLELESCGIKEEAQQRVIVEAVNKAAQDGRVFVLPPGGGDDGGWGGSVDVGVEQSGEPQGPRNASPHALFFKPLRAAGRSAMVLQIIGGEHLPQQQYRAVAGLLDQVGDAAETYLAHRRAVVLDDDRKSLARLLQYADAVHGSLEPERVIYQIANFGRDALGCERVVVWVDPAVKRGLRAVSGVDKPDTRAVLLQAVEKLCKYCLHIKQPIVASRERLPEMPEEEELTQLVRHYFNVSQLDSIFLQPIPRGEDGFLGVLVAEGFDEQRSVNLAGVMSTAAKQGGLALQNALAMAATPLIKPLARLKRSAQDPVKRKKWTVGAVLAGLVLLALILMPWPVKVDCTCELTPATMRMVDAPVDGVQIRRVVRPRGEVAAGEVVIELDADELRTQLYSLQAALEQEQAKLEAIRRTASATEVRLSQLQIERLQHEITLVEHDIAKCLVRSPIDGTILTDQLELREGLTVARGDVLFEVADLTDWELVLEAPQAEIGWVLRGLEAALANEVGPDGQRPGLPVAFYLTAYPEHRLRTWITHPDQIRQRGQIGEGGNVFRVRVPAPAEELAGIVGGLRDGSIGRAKITTDERPLGYVMLRKVIRFFRVTFF